MKLQKMFSMILLGAVLGIQLISVSSATVERCLDTDFHKKVPSAEGSDYVECLAWKDRSCCPANVTRELKEHNLENLFHFSWNHCGDLSQSCRRYFLNNMCFYYCEPNLIKWRARKGVGVGVPVCSDYCDKWFEACKNDMTYSENWFDNYIINHNKNELMKVSSSCHTFAETFKNGEGLCNKLWGPSMKYEETSNCMVMDFKGQNPNDKVTKTG